MASIPQPGHQGENISGTLSALNLLIEAEKRMLAAQRGRVKRLRRDCRRAKRAEAARMCRTYTRAGLFWSGNVAVTAAVVCFAVGQEGAAFQLLQFAFGAWVAALQIPPRR
ncbi:hypothetical protein OHA57_39985 (plasmid) [Streptomyces anulatus]|uniref:hypothetical protein n=1 Tax=Streptomyces anulatus TaxID=1892 RepID=UPI002DD8E739|nr:hypothetical protein [Streptomyces anulatus]WSC66922.1 hypothetical protein OHA57_39985 [Streptomyces anulatus]